MPLTFLFAAGAGLAFGLLRLATLTTTGDPRHQIARSQKPLRAGVVHLTAITAAITAAALLAQLRGAVAWPAASFAATAVYLCTSSVEVGLMHRPPRQPKA